MDDADLMRAAAAGMAGYMLTEEDRASIVQLATLCASPLHAGDDDDESADHEEGPRRGFTRSGEPKMGYVRQKGKGDKVYVDAIEHFNTNIFNSLTGLTAIEFESLYRQVAALIARPIDPKLSMPADEAMLRTPRKKALLPHTMLFFFLFVLRGGTEGSIGYDHLSFRFGISNATVASYIRHVGKALFESLHDDGMSIIRWPGAEERQEMRGLVYGFENCIGFVDGTKQSCFRPSYPEVRDERYCGHHKEFCHSVLLWTDNYGVIIRLDICLDGAEHDRGMYNDSDPYRYPSMFFYRR